MNESATCREYVRPRLEAAGWDDDKHPVIEQKSFTDGRIVPINRDKIKRLKQKRADYLLHYTRDFTIASRNPDRTRLPVAIHPGQSIQR